MKIEELKIEDTADANYFIKKFFNNDYSKIQMTQLEQLVLTAYNMGMGKKGTSAAGAAKASEPEPKPAAKPPKKAPPLFKINDRVKVLADTEIGHSGEIIKAGSEGTISYIKGDTMTALFEAGEDGEMIDIMVLPDKIAKV
jgi:hypothetical protein